MASRFQLYDAFPTKAGAMRAAKDLASAGMTVKVQAIPPQGGYGGYLRWGVFVK